MSYPGKDLREMQQEVHALSVEKGWWEGVKHTKRGGYRPTVDQIMSRLALIHSETAEATEDVRKGRMLRTGGADTGIKPEGFPTELADIVIRVMDLAEGMGIDLSAEIEIKHAFNKTRSYRHGGKRA